MGITKFIANVVTFGAAAKVDDAKASYDGTKWRIENLLSEIGESRKRISNLNSDFSDLKNFFQIRKVKKIIKDKKLINRLTSEEYEVLNKLPSKLTDSIDLKELKNIPKCMISDQAFFAPDDAVSNLAVATAVSLVPGIGQLAAHSLANDECAEIYAAERKLIPMLNELKNYRVKCEAIETKAKNLKDILHSSKQIIEKHFL